MVRTASKKGTASIVPPSPRRGVQFGAADQSLTDAALSEVARSFWAKSGGQGSEMWLSLAQHLMDASDVAAVLFDEYAAPEVRSLMASVWDGNEARARSMLRFLAGVHDVGKASVAFSSQVPSLASFLSDFGVDVLHWKDLPDRKSLPHGFLSYFALVDAIEDGGGDRGRATQWASLVAVHHGRYPNPSAMEKARRVLRLVEGRQQQSAWSKGRRELIEWMARRTGIVLNSSEPSELPRLPIAVASAYGALIVMADWLASNEEFFPLFLRDSRAESMSPSAQIQRVRGGMGRAQMPRPLRIEDGAPVDIEASYRRRFSWGEDTHPTKAQLRAVAIAETEDPDLMIVEAPPGSGKTELAFSVAERMVRMRGLQGVMIALPTQATTNAMFERAETWLSNLLGDEPQRLGIHLAHGKNDLNEEFVRLLAKDSAPLEVLDEEEGTSGLFANRWMAARWRSTLSPIVIGTIDQVLLAALKSRHVLMRHLGLLGKVVILDEVHAADAYMEIYLESALAWLGAFGVPVVLLSATLPSARRQALIAAYRRGRTGGEPGEIKELEGDIGYPVLTVLKDKGTNIRSEVVRDEGEEIRKVIRPLEAGNEGLADFIDSRLASGGCAVVIRNTVGDAQRTYDAILQRFGEESTTLLHSRFLACDRAQRDEQMLALFGKGSSRRPKKHVVVATQVIEQSLDVDFDLMITDPAPMDLVLQRIGRLHRHSGRARPAPLQEAECFVLVDQSGDGAWGFSQGTEAVYGKSRVLRMLAILHDHNAEIVLEKAGDFASFTQLAYSNTPVGPSSWQPSLKEASRLDEAETNSVTEKAKVWSFDPARVSTWTGEALLRDFAGEAATGEISDPKTGLAARPAVRDAEDQIPVLIIPVDPEYGGAVTPPPWQEAEGEPTLIDVSVWPSPSMVSRIRTWSVSLPPWQFRETGEKTDNAVDAVACALWDDPCMREWGFLEHPLLRGELVLPMRRVDAHSQRLETTIRGRRVVYTNQRGLEVQG